MSSNFFMKIGKKYIIAFITILMIVASVSILSIAKEEHEPIKVLEFTYHFQEPELKKTTIAGKEFTELDMPGVISYGDKVGFPVHYSKPVKILIPYGKDIESIIVKGESVEINVRATGIDLLRNPIVPHQKSVPLGKKSSEVFALDDIAYSSEDPIQESNYENLGLSSCRGYSILTLNLNPIEYIPAEGRLFYYPEMNVLIDLKETKNNDELFRGESTDSEWVKTLVLNPDIVDTYPTRKPDTTLYDGGLCDPSDNEGLGYDYVIITRASLVDFTATYNWTDFINSKQTEGLETTIVPYEDIISFPDYYNTTPIYNDSAAKIREFLRDAYQDWGIQYVLIAGDDEGTNSIPRREMDSYAEYNVDSDLYWSNLHNSFNDDMDNYWGEEGDTGFDLYSELWIGSIPCDDETDISNWLTKSFYYADSWNPDYLDNAAFYGGDLDTMWTWYAEGDDFMDFTLYGTNNWLGPDPNHDGPWPSFLGFLEGFDTWNASHPEMAFNTSVRWTGEGSDPEDNGPNPGWQGGSTYQSVDGLKNAINNDQVTLLNAVAHADSDSSMDVEYYDWESNYHNTKPFFLHDYGCHCGDMDGSSDGVLHSMLFHSDTELAFATVMNTGYGWGNLYCTNSSSALQQKLFWDYMFNLSKCGGIENWQLGKAQAFSKDAMAPTITWDGGTFREVIQCCLLFGDPAQKIKTPIMPDKQITTVGTDWNFVSLPFNQEKTLTNITIIYNNEEYTWENATTNNNPTGEPLLNANVFGWDRTSQSYEISDSFQPGEGYWVFAYKTCELWGHEITATPTNQITDLESNWNLIGIPNDEPIDKNDVMINYNENDYTWTQATTNNNPTGSPLIDPNFFGWNNTQQSYEFTDTFTPGKAYWMFSYQQCTLKT